jgi:demethoxyubiquinone hydroxylase (CLK1/Coq7/Cat5 family)
MQIKTSTIFNMVLTLAIVALAINTYQIKQHLNDQLLESSNSVDKINASIAAIKAHEVELETKDVAMSALLADLIIKTQEQGQTIDELIAKQTKKK